MALVILTFLRPSRRQRLACLDRAALALLVVALLAALAAALFH